MFCASDPMSGSVSAYAASVSPRASSGQVALLLLRRPEQRDRLRSEPAVDADQYGERRIEPRHLAEDARVTGGRQADAAVLGRNREPEEPVAGQRADRLLGDRLLLVERRRVDEAVGTHLT